jgi:periplasmic protein CpxP/Spy
MSHRCLPIMLSLPRSLAMAALLSLPLAAASLTPVHAQGKATPAATKPADANAVEQRIAQLHDQLKVTAEQEPKWKPVAQAMRDNAANMDKLIAEKRKLLPANMTAVDDLQTAQEFAQAQVDGLKNLTSTFKTLYDAMSDQQKKNADRLFASFHQAPAAASAPKG